MLSRATTKPAIKRARPQTRATKTRPASCSRRGKRLHRQGDYPAAAKAYQQAYEAMPLPVMLFNIAQVLRLHGDVDEAIEQYEAYLRDEPNGEGSEDARAFLDELRTQRAKSKEPVDEPAVDSSAGTNAGEADGLATAARIR